MSDDNQNHTRMKNRILLLLPVLLVTFAQQLSADMYLRASAMYASPEDLRGSSSFHAAMDASAAYSVGLGYKFSILRVEAEGMFLKNDVGSVTGADYGVGELKSTNLFVNGFVELPGIPIITPYIGVGAGLGWMDFKGDFELVNKDQVKFSERSTLPGYQAIVGVRAKIPLTDISAYANCRYLRMNALRASDEEGLNLKSGDSILWELGLSVSF